MVQNMQKHAVFIQHPEKTAAIFSRRGLFVILCNRLNKADFPSYKPP